MILIALDYWIKLKYLWPLYCIVWRVQLVSYSFQNMLFTSFYWQPKGILSTHTEKIENHLKAFFNPTLNTFEEWCPKALTHQVSDLEACLICFHTWIELACIFEMKFMSYITFFFFFFAGNLYHTHTHKCI